MKPLKFYFRKPRVLVFGSTGMLGSALMRGLKNLCEVEGLTRGDYDLVASNYDVDGVVLTNLVKNFDYVVNAAGMTNRDKQSFDMHRVNADFPLRLAITCYEIGTKLIHISTDCVFGLDQPAPFSESRHPAPQDLYGQSKKLGEDYVRMFQNMVLRTSIIGPEEQPRARNLLTWFLSQTGDVPGFTNHRWSGVTTLELTRIIRDQIILDGKWRQGLYHVCQPQPCGFWLKADVLHFLGSWVFGRVDISVKRVQAPEAVDRRMTTEYPGLLKVRRLEQQLLELRDVCDPLTGHWTVETF